MPACGQHLSKPSRQRLSFSLKDQRLALTQGLEVALQNKGRSEGYARNGGSLSKLECVLSHVCGTANLSASWIQCALVCGWRGGKVGE
jgi:hypothetical protein